MTVSHVLLNRETSGPHEEEIQELYSLEAVRFRVIKRSLGFLGPLFHTVHLPSYYLAPILTIFLMCLLGWLETEVEINGRLIELG